MDETLETVATGIENGNYSQIVRGVLSAETVPMLAILLKVFIWAIAIFVFIGILNSFILPLFNLEFTIKGQKFGGKRSEMFKHKKSSPEKSTFEKEVFLNALKGSIVNLTTQISETTNERYEGISEDTKNKIDRYIERVVKLYKTSINDDYKGSDKDSLLLPESLEYFKELMTLASYENNVIEKTIKAMSQILEQERLGFSKSDIDASRRVLYEELLDSYQSIFSTESYPFNDKISSATADQVIEESAKKQVTDILEKLEDAYKVRDEAYNRKVDLIISQFVNQLEDEQGTVK